MSLIVRLGLLAAFGLWLVIPAHAQSANCDSTVKQHLIPIVSTHTLPAYPPDAVKSNVTGTTLLRVKIDPTGAAYATIVEQSSGSKELDEAASQHVKDYWRWNTTACGSDRITHVSVRWEIHKHSLMFAFGSFLVGLGWLYLGYYFTRTVPKTPDNGRVWLRNHVGNSAYRWIMLSIGIVFLISGAITVVTRFVEILAYFRALHG